MSSSETKECTKCFKYKIQNDFRLRKKKDGTPYRNSQCIQCERDYEKKFKNENKEKLSAKNKEKYQKNKEEINRKRTEIRKAFLEANPNLNSDGKLRKDKKTPQTKKEKYLKNREWQAKNKDKVVASKQKYRDNNLDKEAKYRKDNATLLVEKSKRYREQNKDKVNAALRERRKIPENKLRHTVSVLIRHSLEDKREKSCLEYFGFSIIELKEHLESQFQPWMTWDNHGLYVKADWDDKDQNTWKWQLDHIIPQSDLPYDSMEHENFKKCWSLENLRPLSAKQNHIDGATRARHKKKE